MRTRFYTICASILMAVLPASADDGGSWLSLQFNKRWDSTYGFLRQEHRSCNAFSDTEAMFLAVGGGYRFAPWLNADLSYEFWNINPELKFHKAVLSGTASMTRDGLTVSVREKLEFAVNPVTSSTSLTLRSRLRGQYAIPDTGFRPYAMAEIFNWDKWIRSLYYAGTEIALNAYNVVDVYYMYHLPAGSEPVHILGIGYFFNF